MSQDIDLRTQLSPLMYSLYHLNIDKLPPFKAGLYKKKSSVEIYRLAKTLEFVINDRGLNLTVYLLNMPRQKQLSNEDVRSYLKYIYDGLLNNALYVPSN